MRLNHCLQLSLVSTGTGRLFARLSIVGFADLAEVLSVIPMSNCIGRVIYIRKKSVKEVVKKT